MKREILFRGKRVDNVDWIEGFYVHFENFLVKDVIYSDEHLYKEVNAETIGQFTGLTDKNGNKIFEGDICKDRYGLFGVVEYFDGFGGFIVKRDYSDRIVRIQLDVNRNKFEIIGNIHDNPELLR